MGIWMTTVIASGMVALGLAMGLMTSPRTERPLHEGVRQSADAQARIAFEYLVRDYARRDSAFVGTLHAEDMRSVGTAGGSLANGAFPPSWSATIAPGGAITYCASAPARALPALLKHGYTLESLSCDH